MVMSKVHKQRRIRRLKKDIKHGRRHIDALMADEMGFGSIRVAMNINHVENHVRDMEQELQELQSV